MSFLGKLFSRTEGPNSPEPGLHVEKLTPRERMDAEERAGKIRGKHFTEWIPELNRLRSLGAPAEDKYLALVLDCIEATEQAAVYSLREPAPGYTERAAIVYRRRQDYASEIAVIERWEAVFPPSKRGPGATQGKLAVRLAKAKELQQIV